MYWYNHARATSGMLCLACAVAAVLFLGCTNAPFDVTTLNGELTDDTDPPDTDGPVGSDGDPTDAEPDEPVDVIDPPDDPPANAYCDAVADWLADWAQFEEEVLVLINIRRGEGATCGDNGTFEPTGPLTMDGALLCAARNHSMDMGVRDFFSHTNPDGDGPGARIALAEYDFSTWGENIAWGYGTPASVVEGWMNSPGHCANIMNPSFTEIGVGYYEGSLWTQAFGRPR